MNTKRNPASALTLDGANIGLCPKNHLYLSGAAFALQRPNPRGVVALVLLNKCVIGHVGRDGRQWLAIGRLGYIGAFTTALRASRAVLAVAR